MPLARLGVDGGQRHEAEARVGALEPLAQRASPGDGDDVEGSEELLLSAVRRLVLGPAGDKALGQAVDRSLTGGSGGGRGAKSQRERDQVPYSRLPEISSEI